MKGEAKSRRKSGEAKVYTTITLEVEQMDMIERVANRLKDAGITGAGNAMVIRHAINRMGEEQLLTELLGSAQAKEATRAPSVASVLRAPIDPDKKRAQVEAALERARR